MEKQEIIKPRLKPKFGSKEIAHVALKVRTDDDRNTIKEHTKVLEKYGSVVLGKMGQRMSDPFLKSLNEQIARDVKTYLFLFLKQGWKSAHITYQCLLHNVYHSLPEDKKIFIPKYYLHKSSVIRTWFEIKSIELMSKENMNNIFVLSSNRSIMSVVNSSATVFRVGIEKGRSDG